MICRFCRWWLGIRDERQWPVTAIPQGPAFTQEDVQNGYKLGFQNGNACGELNGRNGVLLEMEMMLAARGKVLNEAEPEDVQAAKRRTVH